MSKYKVIKNRLTQETSKQIDNQVDSTSNPFPERREWIIGFVGRKGSGKTSLIVNLLNSSVFKKRYNNIVMFSPSKRDEKLKQLIDELDADGKYYEKLTNQSLTDVMDNLNEYNDEFKEKHGKKKIPKNLIIIDDCLADLPLSSQKQSAFNKLMVNHRHHHTSVILSTQKFKSLNNIARNNLDGLISFRTANEGEVDAMTEEYGIDKELYLNATEEPHSFLYTHFFDSNKKTYFKNFDRLIAL
jgi:GTPase SAR1 family protein